MAKARSSEDTVRYDDLKKLRKAIKTLREENLKDSMAELKEAGKTAAEIVAAEARASVPVKSGRFRDSIVAKGLTTGGQVTFGGPKAPHGPVNEFGGSLPKRGASGGKLTCSDASGYRGRAAAESYAARATTGNRYIWKEPSHGYFIFPALKRKRPEVMDIYGQRIEALVDRAFPPTFS